MLLDNKNAVIYGAGGSIGGPVAREYAREGARVFLAGRTREKLEAVAEDIRSAGGSAEVAALDALDALARRTPSKSTPEPWSLRQAASTSPSTSFIWRGDVQGLPLTEMATDNLLRAVANGLRTNFITSRAAARHMVVGQGSGIILALGSASGKGSPTDGPHRARRRGHRRLRVHPGRRGRSPRPLRTGHLDGRSAGDAL